MFLLFSLPQGVDDDDYDVDEDGHDDDDDGDEDDNDDEENTACCLVIIVDFLVLCLFGLLAPHGYVCTNALGLFVYDMLEMN